MNTVLKSAKQLLVITALAGMTLASSVTFAAAEVNSLLNKGQINQFQDSDQERVLDADGNVVTSGNLEVGYQFESILRFTDVNGTVVSDNPAFSFPYQLIAHSIIEITDINIIGLTPDLVALGIRNLVFGSSGDLSSAASMADIYERTTNTPGYDAEIDPNTAITQVMSQNFVASAGFIEGGDDFWVATTLLDIAAFGNAIQGSPQQGNGQFGLSILENPGAIPVATNGIQSGTDFQFHDLVGSSSIYTRDPFPVNTGWLLSSNTEARFFVPVPEPSTLALLSLGLLAAGAVSRRRRR